MDRISVGIIGATGYTGSELVRILMGHPLVEIKAITTTSHKGRKLSDIHPHLFELYDQVLVGEDEISGSDLDLVFLALPHGVSQKFVRDHIDDGFKIIDLSGDFRIKDVNVYEKWYEIEHVCPELIKKAVYGLPELFRDRIRESDLIANPGCYPTSVLLGLVPLIKNDLVDTDMCLVDSKSGMSGAGVKAKPVTHFPQANDNMFAYSIGSHRHTPEIEEWLTPFTSEDIRVQFTPHLLPVTRGILSTIYMKGMNIDQKVVDDAYDDMYADEPFVRMRKESPSLGGVRGSNFCDIHTHVDQRTGNVVVVTAIDNLVKGAAGQAVQNMNICLGLEEGTGLRAAPLSP
ncbi:MAG: N-acetyl-gamma-glutamyl-phosphate reductase [Candidatus Thermoplasmatota archaeon]|nr:N-acetyl-gamma-glutamyl-phosphate reductase [Candidatus Thermoplasmatota archaeon]